MKPLKAVFDFYVFSNLHVSFAVFCLTKLTLLTLGQDDMLIPSLVFVATFLAYNGIRLIRLGQVRHSVRQFMLANNKLLIGLSILSGLSLLYFLYQLSYETLLCLVPFSLCTLLYVYPMKKGAIGKYALRKIGYLKLFLIAISWAGVTVLVPVVHQNLGFNTDVWLLFVQRFLFIVVITLPFDIRDLALDHDYIKTIPEVFGLAKTKRFGLGCLMVFLALDFLRVEGVNFQLDLSIAVLSLLFLVRASRTQSKYYSAFWIEAIPILWFGLAWLSE